MKTLKFLTVIALAGCLLSCNVRDVVDESADTSGSSDLLKYMETVSLDSLIRARRMKSMTEVQSQIFAKIAFVYNMNTEFIDGQFVFLTEDEFVSEGLPKSYYAIIIEDINGLNELAHRNIEVAQEFYQNILDSREYWSQQMRYWSQQK
jgi:hypothetical protein